VRPRGQLGRHAATILLVIGSAVAVEACADSRERATGLEPARAAAPQAVPRPAAFVIRFVEDVRDGAGPAAISDYAPQVISRIGAGNMLGAMDTMVVMTAGMQPRVTRQRDTKAGHLIVLSLVHPPHKSGGSFSFVVRRDREGWKIVYDSMLAMGVESYIVNSSSDGAKPSASALRRANSAIRGLRLAALPRQLRTSTTRPRTRHVNHPTGASATTRSP
jgi:hypothetical protein